MIKEVDILSEERLKYIYNIDQADYYIKEGCIALGTGRHPQTKNVFLIFNYEQTQSAYENWCRKCMEYKEYKKSKITDK